MSMPSNQRLVSEAANVEDDIETVCTASCHINVDGALVHSEAIRADVKAITQDDLPGLLAAVEELHASLEALNQKVQAHVIAHAEDHLVRFITAVEDFQVRLLVVVDFLRRCGLVDVEDLQESLNALIEDEMPRLKASLQHVLARVRDLLSPDQRITAASRLLFDPASALPL